MAPLDEESYYEIAKSLHIYNAYYDQNTQNHIRNNVSECNNIKNTFDQGNDDGKFFYPCLQIASFIKHLQEKDVTHDRNEYCQFLNYIINSEIKKIKNPHYENPEYYTKLINAYNTNGFSLKKICEQTSEYISKDIVDKIRKIANIYSKFHNFLNTNDLSSNCEKFGECVQLYKDNKRSCDQQNNALFCSALEKFRIYSSSQSSVIESCPKERGLLLLSTSQENSDDADDLSISYEPPDIDETDLDLGSTRNNLSIAFSILLVISSTMFIIYRFTPIGSWIRLKIYNRKKMFNNSQDEMFQLLQNNRNNSINSNDRGFNVTYHPERNS
ncbi:Plasmodium vivax Vir protein, putative [Plasmodium vivax]|nr:Plasmodium vivax Vir protein, putative [Plasmodium vivax]